MASHTASLPSAILLERQARWLAPARARLLRWAGIAHCHSVLDLGAGRGMVTAELARRSSGYVYALDISRSALYETPENTSVIRIVGNAHKLPFKNRSLELVFSQFTLLWTGELSSSLSEIRRVLKRGGKLCAIEPDYRALIEHPPGVATADVWLAALERAGASSDVGRRLPALLEQQGFDVDVRLLDQLLPPSRLRFAMLRELSLTGEELARIEAAEKVALTLDGWQQLSHLPLFLVNATRTG